jgi:arginase family enzyme
MTWYTHIRRYSPQRKITPLYMYRGCMSKKACRESPRAIIEQATELAAAAAAAAARATGSQPVEAMAAAAAAARPRVYLDIDIDGWRAAYQRAVGFVAANNLKYSLSSDDLEALGGSEKKRVRSRADVCC